MKNESQLVEYGIESKIEKAIFMIPLIGVIVYHSMIIEIKASKLLVWVQTSTDLPWWPRLIGFLVLLIVAYKIAFKKYGKKVEIYNKIFGKIISLVLSIPESFLAFRYLLLFIIGYLVGNITFSIILSLFFIVKG